MSFKKIMNLNLAVLFATALLLASCQGGVKTGSESQATSDSVNVNEFSQNVKDVVYPLPTPFEMTSMLNEIGARYVASSMNSSEKIDKYFTEKSKALNLGVYGADLAYAATYDQKQDVQLYSKAIKTLITDLGISIDYSSMLTEEFKEKVNNKDSLTKVITNTFYSTYKTLSEKSNADLSIMMVSGMWVELMYIATHISEDTYNNSSLVKIIAKQRDSYEKLLSLLKEHNTSKDIKELEDKLLILKPAFDKVDSGLQEKDYKLILTTIQAIRKSLVS
jgi:hypothetical protein